MTEKNINLFINFFVIKYSDFSLFLCKIIAIPLKKVTSLSQQPPSKTLGLVKAPAPIPPHFWKFGTRFKKQKEGADYMGIPSSLFSYFFLQKSRYAHVLECLFNNISGLTVAVLLTTVFISSYSTSLHKFKKLKRTVFKDLWLKHKIFETQITKI